MEDCPDIGDGVGKELEDGFPVGVDVVMNGARIVYLTLQPEGEWVFPDGLPIGGDFDIFHMRMRQEAEEVFHSVPVSKEDSAEVFVGFGRFLSPRLKFCKWFWINELEPFTLNRQGEFQLLISNFKLVIMISKYF